MAATQSNFPFFHTAPETPTQPQGPLPLVTQRISPSRQTALRARLKLAKEPEDARITGGTRSLDRRLLGLNLAAGRPSANAA